MTVYLVPAGRDRCELYSEAPDEPDDAGPVQGHEGFIRRSVHTIGVRWRELVDMARRGKATGRFAKWRDSVVCHLAESIAEQRTLWALRKETAASARYPAHATEAAARGILDALLSNSRRHHLRWLVIDLLLVLITGPLFFFVPGPNVIAYYFLFRVVGHLMSWRGARQAIERIDWRLESDQSLAELASLVEVPRAARASRVAAIAERLSLPRLSAFFDRVAVPSS
jgi:Mitochondrial K+-H+ exchange-related